MKFPFAVALILTALPATPSLASEVGILFNKQVGRTLNLTGSSGIPTEQRSTSTKGFAIRGAYTLTDLWAAKLAVTATYHPESKDDYIHDYLESRASHKFGTYGTQYSALGAQLDWNLIADLHAGLDIRRERLTSDLGGSPSQGTTIITRPWVSAGMGYTFSAPILSPFVRLEIAYALKEDNLGSSWSSDDLRRAMAPRYEVGIYGGVRF